MPINLRGRREKVFGPGHAVPLDRNAKARIEAYVKGYNARNKQPRQHCGPITQAFQRVLKALLWAFHNSRSGCCFPSYEAIAAKAECERSTVAAALKALEWAGVLTWQHRITRIRERCRDLFGRESWRWRVIRTSNAYVFNDPLRRSGGLPASKLENPTGTLNQEVIPDLPTESVAMRNLSNALERALQSLGTAIEVRSALNRSASTVPAT